jgi:hypothetical protein
MARTTVSNVNFGGGGSLSPSYKDSDEQALLDQTNAVSIQLVNVIVLVDIETEPANKEVTAKIAIDGNNAQLKEPDHLLALPCPPYCGKDEFATGRKA